MADTYGWTAPGWEGVRDAFNTNFDSGNDVGAAFSAYHRGEKVVDLWGGIADQDTGAPWNEDTMALVFSTTKGATAMCANKLAQEGSLDVDAPVVTYWPEFGKNGKDTMPVSYLLSHQAGLAWVDGKMSPEEALSWEPVIEALENMKPHWEPGTAHGYHATTFGWLVGEVVRRVSGKSVGTYFHDEIATPLDLDFWIGLPESEESRVATLISMIPASVSGEAGGNAEPNQMAELMAAFMGPDTPLGKALFSPGGALSDELIWNSRAMHAAEVPAANGICDARSLARVYSSCIGEVDGFRLLTPEQLKKATTQLTTGPNTVLLGMEIHFGLGFMLNVGLISMMGLGGPNAFGHFGAGGSVGWADPDAELAVGYVMNRMDIGLAGDSRSLGLVQACYKALA